MRRWASAAVVAAMVAGGAALIGAPAEATTGSAHYDIAPAATPNAPVALAAGAELPLTVGDVVNLRANGATGNGRLSLQACGQPYDPTAPVVQTFDVGYNPWALVRARAGANCLRTTANVQVVVTPWATEGSSGSLRYQALAKEVPAPQTTVTPGTPATINLTTPDIGVPASATHVAVRVIAVSSGTFSLTGCGLTVPLAEGNGFAGNGAWLAAAGGQLCLQATGAPVTVYLTVYGWFDADPGTSSANAPVTVLFPPVRAPGFVAETPSRLFDTRERAGRTPIPAGGVYDLDLSQRAPANATAVAMNVTITEAAADGYVTAYACDSTKPGTSNLNVTRGGTVPNLVTVSLGSTGHVCFYVYGGGHLLADLAGWFVGGDGLGLTPRTPLRVIDTRDPGKAKLGADQTLTLDLTGSVAADAGAVALNVTVDAPEAPGFLTLYPCDAARPGSSNLNYVRGQTVANAVMVRLGTDHRLCLYTQSATHVIVDVTGSFTPGEKSGFYDIAPDRRFDSRVDRSAPLNTGDVVGVFVGTTATSGDLNVTVTSPTGAGYLTVFPCGSDVPLASNLNFVAGQTVANHVVVGKGSGDSVCVYLFANGGTAHVIVDVFGTYKTDTLLGTQILV